MSSSSFLDRVCGLFSPLGREESLTQRGIAVKQFLKNTFAVY